MRLNVQAVLLVMLVTLSGCFNAVISRKPDEQKIVYVAPVAVKCALSIGGAYIPTDPAQATFDCLQIREDPNLQWGFTEGIQGFTFESGFRYKLRVNKVYPDPNLADAFPTLNLIEVLEKTPVSN
jgi:Domain of unknown function (DUF4377)